MLKCCNLNSNLKLTQQFEKQNNWSISIFSRLVLCVFTLSVPQGRQSYTSWSHSPALAPETREMNLKVQVDLYLEFKIKTPERPTTYCYIISWGRPSGLNGWSGRLKLKTLRGSCHERGPLRLRPRAKQRPSPGLQNDSFCLADPLKISCDLWGLKYISQFWNGLCL